MNRSCMKYLSAQGLHNLARNRLMSLAGIAVLSACLILTGVAWLFTTNVNSLVEYMGNQNETVVYVDPEAEEAVVEEVGEQISKIEGVASSSFVSKDDALDTYRGYMEEYADVWDEFEDDNPLKANYRVVVKDLDRMEQITAELEKIPGVVTVSAPIDLTHAFVNVQQVVVVAGYVLVAVLAIVSLVVISNTIRLSVYSRRREINIMKYVGATDGFIRWPFFVEGVGVGLIASAIASVVVLSGYYALTMASENLTGFWSTLLGDSVVPFEAVWYWLLGGFVLGGIVIGGLGSVTSVRKHLNV